MSNLSNDEMYGKLSCLVQEIPKFYKSDLTGNLYDYEKYKNHGGGDNYNGYLDLPKNEYPYSIVYEVIIPKWMERG